MKRAPLGSRRRAGATVHARAAAGVPEPQVVPLPDGSTLYNFTGEAVPVPGAGGAPAPAATAAAAVKVVKPAAPPPASPAAYGRAPFPGREPFAGRAPFKGRADDVLLPPFTPDALPGPPPAPEPTDMIAAALAAPGAAEASPAAYGRAPFPGREPFAGRAPFAGRSEEVLEPFVGLPASAMEEAAAVPTAGTAEAAAADVADLSWAGEASTAAIFNEAAEVDVAGLSWAGEASTAAIFEDGGNLEQAELEARTVKELKVSTCGRRAGRTGGLTLRTVSPQRRGEDRLGQQSGARGKADGELRSSLRDAKSSEPGRGNARPRALNFGYSMTMVFTRSAPSSSEPGGASSVCACPWRWPWGRRSSFARGKAGSGGRTPAASS